MGKVSYWRVSQFDPQPCNAETLEDLISMEKAIEVSEDFEPYWGGGVYKLDEEGKLTQHKCNWDSSD